MTSADLKLDARLRAIPLPDGLLDRLMALPLAGDGEVDELVREVALPAGLLQRLLAIPLTEDDGLDEALRNVPVPEDLVTSCRHHPRRYLARREGRMDRALRISRIAMALSLILAVTLSLGGAMLLITALNRFGIGPSLPQLVKENPTPTAPAEKRLEWSWGMLGDDASGSGGVSPWQPGDFRREIELVEVEPLAVRESRDAIASATLPRGADPLAVISPGVNSSHNWDNLPELSTSRANLDPHGLDWPVVPGSNRPFLVAKGFHPFVSPAAHPRLQTCPVPLAVEPSSYELARRYIERNELPPADRVRSEEFLAAVDYHFPKPRHQSLGLIVAGGPSPISGEGFCLLQVGVQAQQNELSRHAPQHVVFLVDTSTSMRWGSRIEIVRRALRDLPAIVGPEDRLSLVTFNQAAHVLVENSNRDALPQFAAAADSLSAEGATNLVAGLREAFGVARQTPGGAGRPAVRVVLLTDGLLDLEPAIAEKIEHQVAQAAGEKVPLDVIDLGQQKTADPQVAALARAGQGTVHRAISAQQIGWALREIVTGRSQLVARAARLQVTFNPKSVLEYRLVGHESGDWDGLLPGSLEADFHAGQAATALFEVRLAPDGPNDLASVDLAWYTPDDEKTLAGKTAQKAHATVERKHFAASLTSSAPSLQEAAVVAYAAEVLRHSPFIFQRHPGLMPAALLRAVELSSQVDSQLQLRPSFDEFVSLIRQEVKARPAKRSAKD